MTNCADQIAALVALAANDPEPTRRGNTLPATGYCHDCDRRISGERRFCGRCAARRDKRT